MAVRGQSERYKTLTNVHIIGPDGMGKSALASRIRKMGKGRIAVCSGGKLGLNSSSNAFYAFTPAIQVCLFIWRQSLLVFQTHSACKILDSYGHSTRYAQAGSSWRAGQVQGDFSPLLEIVLGRNTYFESDWNAYYAM